MDCNGYILVRGQWHVIRSSLASSRCLGAILLRVLLLPDPTVPPRPGFELRGEPTTFWTVVPYDPSTRCSFSVVTSQAVAGCVVHWTKGALAAHVGIGEESAHLRLQS